MRNHTVAPAHRSLPSQRANISTLALMAANPLAANPPRGRTTPRTAEVPAAVLPWQRAKLPPLSSSIRRSVSNQVNDANKKEIRSMAASRSSVPPSVLLDLFFFFSSFSSLAPLPVLVHTVSLLLPPQRVSSCMFPRSVDLAHHTNPSTLR